MTLATPGRWLRHKATGHIYGYSSIMAGNAAVEECTEEQAFPERFIPNKQKGRKTGMDLSSSEAALAAAKPKKVINVSLGRDAAKGLKK